MPTSCSIVLSFSWHFACFKSYIKIFWSTSCDFLKLKDNDPLSLFYRVFQNQILNRLLFRVLSKISWLWQYDFIPGCSSLCHCFSTICQWHINCVAVAMQVHSYLGWHLPRHWSFWTQDCFVYFCSLHFHANVTHVGFILLYMWKILEILVKITTNL